MSRSRVIIELSPSRVEVGVLRGKSVERWRSKRFGRADWPVNQTEAAPTTANAASGMFNRAQASPAPTQTVTIDAMKAATTEAAETIITLLRELEIENASATLVYHMRGAQAELVSCASSISIANADQAARLALGNVADFPIDDAPLDSCTLLIDAAGKAGSAAAARQRHTLIAGDAEHRCLLMHDLLRAGGVEVERMVPSDAVAIADAVRAATSTHADGQITAALWIGEHSTTLAVGAPGRLIFVRTISSGTEILADALTRPLRPKSPDDAPVTLAHPQARALLLEAGVPTPDAMIASQPTLAGSALLPHLQPVLQRMAVELKQSLRFGVSEAERPNIRIVTMGPGASVPALGAAFARLSGFNLAVPSDTAVIADAQDSSTGGLIAGLCRCPHLSIALLPEGARAQKRQVGLRKAMMIGACVAAAYIGFDAIDSRASLSKARSQLQSIQAHSQADQGPAMVRQRALESRQALTGVESRVRLAMGESPNVGALWTMLSQNTSEEMRVLSLGLSRSNTPAGDAALTLRAYIRLTDTPDAAGAIKEYLDRLASVPLVQTVRLGGTQRVTVNGHEAQAFDATIVPIGLPPSSLTPSDATASAGSTSSPEARP